MIYAIFKNYRFRKKQQQKKYQSEKERIPRIYFYIFLHSLLKRITQFKI